MKTGGMVAIMTKRRSTLAKPYCGGGKFKPQTMIMVTFGLAMLCLFSLEPVIVLEDGSSESSLKRSMTFSSKPRPKNTSPSRYGMAPKQSLRTPIMHPLDTFVLEKGRRENESEEMILLSPLESSQKPSLPTTPTTIRMTSHPRVVLFDDLEGMNWSKLQSKSTIVSLNSRPIRFESMSLSSVILQQRNQTETELLPFEQPFVEQCEPIHQPQVHPTCNQLHELTMDNDDIALLSTKGSWRTAWTIQNDTAVLKILQWTREFDREAFEHHALDVMVSDVLTASPYVIDAYAFCGQSILQEWAPSGGRDFVKSYDIRNRQRLKIARDLARGLADLQALQAIPHESFKGSDGLTSFKVPSPPPLVFSHNDINIANTIYTSGRIKWNDFNIGVLLRSKIGSNWTEECGAPVTFRADLWRSPEEVRNTSYVQLQYTDMYGFGNILYQVMTRHQPWTHKEPEGKLTVEQVAQRKREGRLPAIPEQYRNTTNKDLQTLVLATMSCYHPVPSKRLTAYELSHALSYVYDRLQHKKKVPFTMLRDLFLSK